jgi:predicted Zn-dependent peptidase
VEFADHTLPNGLKIVAECDADAHSSAFGFFVKTGARDESDATAGVSHFLEHMMFKGTPTRSADDVNREFDELGAHYNAFTNEENTVYHAAVLPEYQHQAVALLADILRPSLREDDFNTEKKVILEEIKMYEDQPPFGADEKCRAAYFGPHPLGRSVLGTAESVTDLPVSAMRDYFESRYSPGNVVLAAAGRIDFPALVDTAKQCCGNWRPVAVERKLPAATPRFDFNVLSKDIATQQYVMELAPAPAAADADRYAAKLLATILGDDSGSRLYWELVDPGLAEQVSLSHCEYFGAGLMITYMSCEPNCAADNLQSILNVYRLAEAKGFAEAELSQAKSKIRSRLVLSSERPRGRLFAVGSDWVYRRQYETVGEELDAIAGVTLDQIHALLKKYPLSRCATLAIGPMAKLSPPQ